MTNKIRTLTASEFEQYVAELVQALKFAKQGIVYRNRRFAGIRQPGVYEIDVALEIQLDPAINFTLIVECKNWKRRVDRPIVQKLAQTRDAIGADKAAIASPLGFTKEAKEVARTLGIALWVITLHEWIVWYSNYPFYRAALSLESLENDRSRNWAKKPAAIRLVCWSPDQLEMFPQELDLPAHLRWARFFSIARVVDNVRDARDELVQKLPREVFGSRRPKWELCAHPCVIGVWNGLPVEE